MNRQKSKLNLILMIAIVSLNVKIFILNQSMIFSKIKEKYFFLIIKDALNFLFEMKKYKKYNESLRQMSN